MRAMSFQRFGGPEVLELVELPEPTPGPDQVSIRVVAASVNPIDWKRASGRMRLVMPVTFPNVPGYDVAGEVVGVGPGVTGFAGGDRVHARLLQGQGAACAEFTVAGVGDSMASRNGVRKSPSARRSASTENRPQLSRQANASGGGMFDRHRFGFFHASASNASRENDASNRNDGAFIGR